MMVSPRAVPLSFASAILLAVVVSAASGCKRRPGTDAVVGTDAAVGTDAGGGTDAAGGTDATGSTDSGPLACGCGDTWCDPGEDPTTCPADCTAPGCGDSYCAFPDEDTTNCPSDCTGDCCGDATDPCSYVNDTICDYPCAFADTADCVGDCCGDPGDPCTANGDGTCDRGCAWGPDPECLPVPPGWTCSDSWYGDTICDCDCGVADVDCTMACPVIPAGWVCPTTFYDDGGCDCGCGAVDIDCTTAAATGCTTPDCCDDTSCTGLGCDYCWPCSGSCG